MNTNITAETFNFYLWLNFYFESIQGSLVKYVGLSFVLFNVRHWSEAEEVKDGGWKRLLD